MSQGLVAGISVSHDHADLEGIEAATAGDERARIDRLLATEGVNEAFVLDTCNRAEAYVVAGSQTAGRAALAAELGDLDPVEAHWLKHDEAIEHLLRVGAGLESMVLGENEILGQLRTARERARRADALGPILGEATEKAIRVGERARTETAINDGVTSIGRAAAAVAAERRELEACTGVVVGTGEMGTVVAQALADHAIDQLIVCNRTRSRAVSVAQNLQIDADARALGELADAVAAADVVVSATGSSDPVMDPSTFAGAGETLVIDIAQPRDIAPETKRLDGIELLDLEALESRTAATEQCRLAAAREVEEIVETERQRLDAQLKRKQADAVIRLMYEGASAIKRQELDTAWSKLEEHGELDETEREIIESMADAIVGQIMAAPTKSLREAAEREEWEKLQTALQLFDPDFQSGAVSRESPRSGDAAGPVTDDV